MTDQAPDDIFALYSRFDLDGENYRVFLRPDPVIVKPLSVPTELVAEAPANVEKSEPARPASEPPQPVVELDRPLATGHGTEPAAYKPAPASANRVALHNLWRHVAPAPIAHHSVSAAAFAAACISVRGAAGGAGSTTVAATLARLMSKSRRRCAIFDETNDLTLPIFFGSQRIASDHRRFAGLQSIFEPSIRILSRELFDQPHMESDAGANFIERHVSQFAGEFDHLIFDHPARCVELTGAGLTIYVAVPDVSSLVGIRKLKRELDETHAAGNAMCVLNRFDATLPLHREVLAWYQENFSHVVTIHQSQLVPEALAEGTTVIDWAPQTTVSMDFVRLFKLVNQLLGGTNTAESNRLDEIGFESERLPLCS